MCLQQVCLYIIQLYIIQPAWSLTHKHEVRGEARVQHAGGGLHENQACVVQHVCLYIIQSLQPAWSDSKTQLKSRECVGECRQAGSL